MQNTVPPVSDDETGSFRTLYSCVWTTEKRTDFFGPDCCRAWGGVDEDSLLLLAPSLLEDNDVRFVDSLQESDSSLA